MLAPRMLLFLLFDHSWNHSWSEVIRICLHKRLWAKCCSKFRWCSKFFELSAFALLVVFYFVCLWALCLCVCTSSMFLILLIWIRIFLVLPVLTTMGSTSASGRFVPFSCIKSLFVSVMAHILKLMPQITTLGKSVSILLTPFCATPLNGNYLVLSWTVTLPVNFGLLCCLSTNNRPVKIFMNFRINSFRLLFFLRSPSLIFNASLKLILSELVALGNTPFNEDTMISKLLSSLPEGFDHFLTSWESTPASEQTISNIKEELKIKKRILNETTATTSAFYSHTWDPHGRGRFPSQFPHGHCRGLPISGSGFSPLSRGVSPSSHGTPFLHDRHLSRPSPQYSADLAHVKQHTRYIECGAYMVTGVTNALVFFYSPCVYSSYKDYERLLFISCSFCWRFSVTTLYFLCLLIFERFTSYEPLSLAHSWPITSVSSQKTYVVGVEISRYVARVFTYCSYSQ